MVVVGGGVQPYLSCADYLLSVKDVTSKSAKAAVPYVVCLNVTMQPPWLVDVPPYVTPCLGVLVACAACKALQACRIV